MVTLTAQAVYRLPGVGRPLRAVPTGDGGYLLYDSELGPAAPPRFTIDSEGRLVDWHSEETRWTVADLTEGVGRGAA